MKYQFDIKITDKDYYDFNKWCLFNLPVNKKTLLELKLWVPALFIFFLLLDLIRGEELLCIGICFVLYAIISIVWILTVKYFMIGIMKKNIKRMKKNGKLPYSKKSNIQFTEDRIIETTEERITEILYTAIHNTVIEEGECIYIFENQISAFIIPSAVFKTEEEKEEFIKFITEKTKKEF